jgi:type VI secretion system protein VasD
MTVGSDAGEINARLNVRRHSRFDKIIYSLLTSSLLTLAGASVILGGCSKPPPPPRPPPPTIISLQISATADVNATPESAGAPVVVRIYQLASRSSFESAEFFPLYHADAATLGPDLLKKDEFLLVPGGKKSLTLMPDAPVRAVGIFAAYADFQNVQWRAAADIPAHQTTEIKVTADRPGLKLDAKSDKPAAP